MNRTVHHRSMLWLFLCLLSPVSLLSQSFHTQVVNKGPLYGTASILQDYDNDGDLDAIVTRRSATREPLPSSVELLENDGAGNFTRHSLITEGLTLPADIDFEFMGGVGDDNGADYVVCETNSPSGPGSLAVYWREESGAYTKTVLKDSVGFDQAALGYFNKDAYPDIVAVGFRQPSVTVYLGKGLGAFDAVVVDDSVNQVTMVEADDIDGDGDTDIIIGGGVFRILYNDGSAGFDSTKSLITYQNYNSSGGGIAIADLNNDGVKDILSFARVGFGGLYFLDGANDFEDLQIDIDGIDLGGDLVVFDIDGNGMLDIVRQNAPDSYIAVLYQDSTMKFRREIIERYWDNRGAGQMSVGDLDGDGDQDLFVAENGNIDGDVSWYENIEGTLYRHTLFGEVQSISALKAGDIDGMEIRTSLSQLAATCPVWVHTRTRCSGTRTLVKVRCGNGGSMTISGFLPIWSWQTLIPVQRSKSLPWQTVTACWYTTGIERPNWLKVVIDSARNPPLGITIPKVSATSLKWIVLCESSSDGIIRYQSSGATWTPHRFRTGGWAPAPREIEVADLNGDGGLGLSYCFFGYFCLGYPAAGNGVGKPPLHAQIPRGGQLGSDLELGDWDRDGAVDIVASFDRGQGVGNRRDVALFLNDGNGNFAGRDLHHAQERTRVIKLVDIDKDGDLDLIIGGNSVTVNDGFQLLINDADTIGSVINLSNVAVDIYGLDAADIDGDGLVDIVATDRESRSLLFLRGGVGTDVRSSEGAAIPATYALLQNYPNPFNPTTGIRFQVPALSEVEGSGVSEVKITVYDILGREVAVLVNERKAPGSYEATFDGSRLASGVYYYRLTAGSFMQVKKMLLVK